MPSTLYTLWQTTRASCEVMAQPLKNLTVMVWVESTLVFQAVVSNAAEAQQLATDLRTTYGG
jgi:hypothetical protein